MKQQASATVLLKDTSKAVNGSENIATRPQVASASTEDSLALMELSRSVLRAIKIRDYNALATLMDPADGVRFSLYAYIDTTDDRIVSREELLSYGNKDKKFYWGIVDASDDDTVKLSISKYFSEWVYDVDFLNAPDIALDKFIGFGNSLNNHNEIYPGLHFVEYHFPGFDKKLEGMDWRSLRLVFRKTDGRYFLVGVVHDQWTI